jgi:hypothetical protein
MNLESLKDALGDEKFAALSSYVTDLIGQRDTARNESINGRKKLKADLDAAHALAQKALDKLGVESADELETLPDAKGQGEALRQFETKLKRAERERDEFRKAADEAASKYRSSQQKAAISEALAGHEFVARDIVETYISQKLAWEGDDLLFKSDDGRLIPIKDGVAGFAKTRPELLKPSGTGGAGVRSSNAGSGGQKVISAAEFDAKSPKDQASLMASGYSIAP